MHKKKSNKYFWIFDTIFESSETKKKITNAFGLKNKMQILNTIIKLIN